MKGLTLLQPWASAIPHGLKSVETRSWSTKYRGPVVIHSSMRMSRECVDAFHSPEIAAAFAGIGITDPKALPLGRVLAIANLAAVYPTVDVDMMHFGKGISDRERAFGNYDAGRFAWYFDTVTAITDGPLIRGRLGLWKPTQAEADAIWDATMKTPGAGDLSISNICTCGCGTLKADCANLP